MKQYLLYIAVSAGVLLGAIFITSETFHEKNLNSRQVELSPFAQTDVISENGALVQTGWSRHVQPFSFNKSRVNPSTSPFFTREFNRFRYKKWEAIMFTSEDFIFLWAPYDITYTCGYILHYSDLKNPQSEIEETWYLAISDRVDITDQCYENCDMYKYDRSKNPKSSVIESTLVKTGLNSMNLKLNYDDGKSSKISLDVQLSRSDQAESMVTLTPISEDKTLFYYNLKQNLIIPSGSFNLNGQSIDLSKAHVTYDSGRGVWPNKSGWIWVNGNGRTSVGTPIGINIGHGFSHPETSSATEDCYTLNDIVYKLPAMNTVKPKDPMKPWIFTVSELTKQENLTGNSCHIEFRPIKRKIMGTNLIVGKMSFGINYGQFVGVCKGADGKEHFFDNVYGIIEEKKSVW